MQETTEDTPHAIIKSRQRRFTDVASNASDTPPVWEGEVGHGGQAERLTRDSGGSIDGSCRKKIEIDHGRADFSQDVVVIMLLWKMFELSEDFIEDTLGRMCI